jgi:hypothetical protein
MKVLTILAIGAISGLSINATFVKPHAYLKSTKSTSSTSQPATSWSKTKNYGAGKGKLVGKAPLSSKTKAPLPHDYNGKRYNSTISIFTNKYGQWVYYYTPSIGTKTQYQCYDKNHKHTSCDRDIKAIQKDW